MPGKEEYLRVLFHPERVFNRGKTFVSGAVCNRLSPSRNEQEGEGKKKQNIEVGKHTHKALEKTLHRSPQEKETQT